MAEGDGGLYGPKTGACKEAVSTPAEACSQCTVDNCCAQWDACFSDAECRLLNQCATKCYK
jgi:hypothetical protein